MEKYKVLKDFPREIYIKGTVLDWELCVAGETVELDPWESDYIEMLVKYNFIKLLK